MRKLFYFFTLALFTILLSSCVRKRVVVKEPNRSNQIVVVQKAPPAPKVVKVKRCGPNKVWKKGHWAWNGRKYIWENGHCDRKRKGKSWIPGHWNKTSNGWKWKSGHWR